MAKLIIKNEEISLANIERYDIDNYYFRKFDDIWFCVSSAYRNKFGMIKPVMLTEDKQISENIKFAV